MEQTNTNNYVGLVVLVLAIGLISIVAYVSIDAFYTVSDVEQTESFTVTDFTVNRDCNLAGDPNTGGLVVRFNNGTGWVTLGVGDYTVSGNTVTVLAAAMD